MKRMIKSATNPDTEYCVQVGFGDHEGRDAEIYIDARIGVDKEELEYIVQEDYAYDLLRGEVVGYDEDTSQYDVDVIFDVYDSWPESFTVLADDEDEAIEEAIEEAKELLEVINFYDYEELNGFR